MALTAACSSPRPGMKATLTFLDVDLRPSCRRRMFRDDAENLCRLDNILRLAAHHDLLAHQRELDRAVGKRFLDFPFQHLERLLEGFHLGLQTLPLFQHVQRRAFRIGQDHDHVAQGPVLRGIVGIARIGKPEVKHGPARLLADDGKFLVGDDLKTGHVFVGDVDAARLLSQDDHLGPAHDDLDRVLRGDFALDELPVLSLDLRRRLGGAQSWRKPKRRQTELTSGRTAMRCLERVVPTRRRLNSARRSAGRLRALNRRSTRPNDLRAGRVLRQAFRRASGPRLAAGRERVRIAAVAGWDGRFRSGSCVWSRCSTARLVHERHWILPCSGTVRRLVGLLCHQTARMTSASDQTAA